MRGPGTMARVAGAWFTEATGSSPPAAVRRTDRLRRRRPRS